MPVKVKLASKVAREGGVKLAVHAAAGMGKSMLAATLTKPVVILTERTGADCFSDENIRQIYGGKGNTKIGVVEAYTIEDVEEAFTELVEDERFDTIVLDSASELSKMLLKLAMEGTTNKMQAYGMMADNIDELLRNLIDCPKNIVFLFHSHKVEVYDEEGNEMGTNFVAGFEGQKMKTDFSHMIGDIFCIVNDFDDQGEETRLLRTRQRDTPFYAKNRSGMLKDLEPMNLQAIIDKLSGVKNPSRKKARGKKPQ